jgi:hypothetical protein
MAKMRNYNHMKREKKITHKEMIKVRVPYGQNEKL